ncbi:MAG: permease [Thermodesulfobacteriota bacterium]|jgi:hypothetical protein
MDEKISCSCSTPLKEKFVDFSLKRKLFFIAFGLLVWWFIYLQLSPAVSWLAFKLLSLSPGSHLGGAVFFFLYDAPKALMLLTLVVFGVGILRSFFTPEKTRAILSGKKESLGNVMAAGLGVATPFCTCSAIPLFIGFIEAGVPLGVTLSFLISTPMINEIALVLLFGLFSWKVAALYLITGLLIAIVCGWVIGRLGMEKYIEDWVREMRSSGIPLMMTTLTWSARIDYAWQAVKDIVGKVWPYLLAGIAVGAAIHGYVPVGFMASFMGREAWWSMPLAVILGVPMYSNAAGIIPIVQALLEKGAALGTVLAFMMAVIGLSLPETIILRKVLKPTLIAVFIGVVTTGILLVGFLFNAVL